MSVGHFDLSQQTTITMSLDRGSNPSGSMSEHQEPDYDSDSTAVPCTHSQTFRKWEIAITQFQGTSSSDVSASAPDPSSPIPLSATAQGKQLEATEQKDFISNLDRKFDMMMERMTLMNENFNGKMT